MKAKRGKERVTLKSKGSAVKRRSKARTETLDRREWSVGEIAWNRDGNIIILDPRVAKFVREQARKDREFEVGIPDVPVEVGGERGGSAADATAPTTPISNVTPPHILTLCGCGVLRFTLSDDSPARTKLLSSERMR